MKIYILLFLFIALLTSCDKNNSTIADEPVITELKAALIKSNNNFSIDIFKEIVGNEDADKNVFISPLSMYYALSMAGTGSANLTKQEFVNVLGWANKTDEEILTSMQELYQSLMPNDSNSVSLEIANSLWSRQGAPIKETYKSKTKEYFDAEVRELDFSSAEAVHIINSWIEVKTNNKIVDMLDYIPADAFMYLINAVYFKGSWKYEFKTEDNINESFYKADGSTINVDYMRQKTNLKYYANAVFTSVKLPYTDTNFYMTFLVPNYNISINDLMAQMTIENWNNWNTQYKTEEVTVTLPKFNYEFGTRLINDELKALGLADAFTETADFSKITDNEIFISRVLHKAFIEVNEKGSEAAAATIVEMIETSAGPNEIYNLTANKPFIFAICHEKTNTLMFVGKVAVPHQ
jgi:serpin B